MRFADLAVDTPPQMDDLERQVYTIQQQYGALRLHDTLLCQAYHLIFDGWQFISEAPNHWIVSIPKARADERSDASIVRARREVANKLHEPSLDLSGYIDPDWDEEGWLSYRDDRINAAITGRFGRGAVESCHTPDTVKDQVAWLLQNIPETRASDTKLIQEWMEVWGGWRKGGTHYPETDEAHPQKHTKYSIPKSYQWLQTTPETITDARRKWHSEGLFLPDEATQERRKDLEKEVRQAFREGEKPWSVIS